MTHFEYMVQHGQMSMFDFLSVQQSDHEPQVDRKPSTNVYKPVDKVKLKGPRIRGYIVRI